MNGSSHLATVQVVLGATTGTVHIPTPAANTTDYDSLPSLLSPIGVTGMHSFQPPFDDIIDAPRPIAPEL